MRIEDLFREVEDFRLLGDSSLDVSALAYRSSDVGPGHLFFCVPGYVRDGHAFAPEAVKRGATCLCVERPLDLAVCQVLVPSVRAVMGPVSAAFFEHPSRRLMTAGITGTNGKTTSAYLASWLLEAAGYSTGLLGTIEKRIGGVAEPAVRTTPEAVDTQRDLAAMVRAGDRAAIMEVSSHALELGRPRGIDFDAVAFTNLTQDHLDFHDDLDSYFRAKAQLFLDPYFAGARPPAVLNLDDAYVRGLARELDAERLLLFTMEEARVAEADICAENVQLNPSGTTFRVVLRNRALARIPATAVVRDDSRYGVARPPDTCLERLSNQVQVEIEIPLLGRFNVANALTAIGIGLALGLDVEVMAQAMALFPGVPGRMETIDEGQDFAVIVDYAHTPDSVASVLRTARGVGTGRILGVLGCGGDRDRGKRPKMGMALEEGADVAVLTSDNPRSERPDDIIGEMLAGLRFPERALVEPDRRAAIATALSLAEEGDIVAILGKGHEPGQQFGLETVPFDDRQVAREELRRLRARSGLPDDESRGAGA